MPGIPSSAQKQATFKEHLYANLLLWGWAGIIMIVSIILRDNHPTDDSTFKKRQEQFRKVRKEKAKQFQQKPPLTDKDTPRLITKRNAILPTPSVNTK